MEYPCITRGAFRKLHLLKQFLITRFGDAFPCSGNSSADPSAGYLRVESITMITSAKPASNRFHIKPVKTFIPSAPSAKQRFESIDIVRGAIMIIMALDHVRHFLHLPAMTDEPTNLATTTPVLFFTRWITHFCAPAFLFLSGISAFISGQSKTKKELSSFLITRGLWLVFIELSVIAFSWSFDPLYHRFFLQVIWAIGWSMIILGLLVRTSTAFICVAGCVLFFGHNILDYVSGTDSMIWKLLLTTKGDLYQLSENRSVTVIYAILPWTSLMLLGYAAGQLYRKGSDDARRRKILLWSGIGMVALFIVLRLINGYGDPASWPVQKNTMLSFLSFLNTTKYPVSLQYCCMTVGPVLILLALLKDRRTQFAGLLMVYGKVPFFYYILHFFLIHIICGVLFLASGYSLDQANDPRSFIFFRPAWFGFDLWVTYAAWIAVVLILYFPCRWFAKYKAHHRKWWLSYV